jgi:hypothetical protein
LSEHPDFKCDEQSCFGKLNGVTYSLSRGWRKGPKKCADVMLSLSYVPRYCDPEMKITGRDVDEDGTYTFDIKNGKMTLRESPRQFHRPWSE